MRETYKQKTIRSEFNTLSFALVGLFAIALLAVVTYNEMFLSGPKGKSLKEYATYPIAHDVFDNIRYIKFKNRLGSFDVALNEAEQFGQTWSLVRPKKLPAKKKTIQKILKSFKALSVRTIHQYEPINIQAFSIDTPIMAVDFYTKLDEHIQIKVGLLNPINSTSYIHISNSDVIYQTSIIENDLESLGVSDFIDARIFSHEIEAIEYLEIFNYDQKESFNKLSRLNDFWTSKRYKRIDQEKTSQKIDELLNIQSHMIVDTDSQAVNNIISKYLKRPRYRVKIISQKNTTNYTITNTIGEIKELKLGKGQYFIVSSDRRKFPHIIEKKYLKHFKIRYDDLRK